MVAIMIFMGGGYFALKTIKSNRSHPVWVPVQIDPELPSAKRDEIIAELKKKLTEQALLEKVSHDLGLTRKMELPTDRDVALEIGRRMFVRIGDMDTPMGKVPALLVGVNGKVKERELSGAISMRLMEDVYPILGIPRPRKK